MTGFYDALNALFDTINRALKLTFWTVWGGDILFLLVGLQIGIVGMRLNGGL